MSANDKCEVPGILETEIIPRLEKPESMPVLPPPTSTLKWLEVAQQMWCPQARGTLPFVSKPAAMKQRTCRTVGFEVCTLHLSRPMRTAKAAHIFRFKHYLLAPFMYPRVGESAEPVLFGGWKFPSQPKGGTLTRLSRQISKFSTNSTNSARLRNWEMVSV